MVLVGLVVRCLTEFCRQRILDYLATKEFLDALEEVYLVVGDERYCYSVALGTGSTSDAVDIVLNVARHVVVDYHLYVVDVYAACYDVGSHKHVDIAGLEAEHHLVALSL